MWTRVIVSEQRIIVVIVGLGVYLNKTSFVAIAIVIIVTRVDICLCAAVQIGCTQRARYVSAPLHDVMLFKI